MKTHIKPLVGLVALATASTGFAQQLEEIVVTAQKREQSLSDVPMSVDYTIHSKDLNGTVTKGETSISKVFVTFDSAGDLGFTEFGTVFSGDSDFGDFSADVNSGKIRLRFTRRSGRDGAIQVKPFKTIIT